MVSTKGRLVRLAAAVALSAGVPTLVSGSSHASIATLPKKELIIQIDGPTSVRRWEQCTWWATVGGGVPPYSYSWNKGGTNQWLDWTAVGTSPFTLIVTVTDANNEVAQQSVNVTVSTSAPSCS